MSSNFRLVVLVLTSDFRASIRESLGGLEHLYSERDALHVEDLRERLVEVLKDFREQQIIVMARVPPEYLVHSTPEAQWAEDFSLGVPSDFSEDHRLRYGLSNLAQQEARLRESQISTTIVNLKFTVNRLLALLHYKSSSVETERLRSRTAKSIMKVVATRDVQLATYNEYRKVLIALHVNTDITSVYPPLTPYDTFKKDPNRKRRVGDSRRREGTLWTVGEASKRLAEAELKDDLPVGLGVVSEPVRPTTLTRFTKRQCTSYFSLCHNPTNMFISLRT